MATVDSDWWLRIFFLANSRTVPDASLQSLTKVSTWSPSGSSAVVLAFSPVPNRGKKAPNPVYAVNFRVYKKIVANLRGQMAIKILELMLF